MKLAIALAATAIVTGLILGLTVGSLLAGVLVIGGVLALGALTLPAIVDRFARFLSTGAFRRQRYK